MRSYLVSHVKLAVLASSNSGNEQARERGWLVWKVTFLCQEAERHRVNSQTFKSKTRRCFETAGAVEGVDFTHVLMVIMENCMLTADSETPR